jgi:hypothetical protein
MSSKFIHQNVGAIVLIVLIISSVSCVSKTIGKAFTHANSLKSIHFHSITGNPASGQIFQSHKTALQSLITAIVSFFIV